MFEGDSKFLTLGLDSASPDSTGNKVAYMSYPRCGNSFLRKYLQLITGVATGADMSMEFDIDLQQTDFKGQETVNESVWINKTHAPVCMYKPMIFNAHKIICCLRNPYDCVASCMHFFSTHLQGGQMKEKFT